MNTTKSILTGKGLPPINEKPHDLDEIIKALEICSQARIGCNGCPYKPHKAKCECSWAMKRDAIAAIKELRASLESSSTIIEMQGEVDAQAQAIETLHLINAKLEGKVEAYKNMLQRLVHE